MADAEEINFQIGVVSSGNCTTLRQLLYKLEVVSGA